MTIEELIEVRLAYAEKRRDDAFLNGTVQDAVYWRGYIDGIKAVQRDLKKDG